MKCGVLISPLVMMLTLWIAPAFADETPATQPSPQVAQLIADLGSPNFGARELSEKKLIDLGPDIEPQLRSALQQKLSDEARARLEDVLGQLDETKALHATITMHYKNAPLTTILNDFAWQAGSDMGVREPSVTGYAQQRTASVDLDNADFWQSMRAISDASGLHPCIGPRGLDLSPSQQRAVEIDFGASPYAKDVGGLFIAPQMCQESRTVNYNTPNAAETSTLMLYINVIPEPKLRVVGAANWDWLKECVDDKGHSLLPVGFNRRNMFRGFYPRGLRPLWYWPLQVNLQGSDGTKIAKLKGELDFSVQTKAQTLVIDDITHARGTTKSDSDITITVLSCIKAGMNYQLEVSFHGATMGDAAVQDFVNSVELLDDEGDCVGRQAIIPRPSANELVLNLIFAPIPDTPTELRWERTLEQKRLKVPFELDDLPLFTTEH